MSVDLDTPGYSISVKLSAGYMFFVFVGSDADAWRWLRWVRDTDGELTGDGMRFTCALLRERYLDPGRTHEPITSMWAELDTLLDGDAHHVVVDRELEMEEVPCRALVRWRPAYRWWLRYLCREALRRGPREGATMLRDAFQDRPVQDQLLGVAWLLAEGW